MFRFQVTVTDPNGGDDLFVRWFSDFPPASPFTRSLIASMPIIVHRSDGAQQVTSIDMTVDCLSDNLPPGLPSHQIAVLVGDRDFQPESTDFTLLQDGSRAVVGGWIFQGQCPSDVTP